MTTGTDDTAPPARIASAPDDTHRCHICGAANAVFGFGPPLTPKGRDLWACDIAHRDQIDRMLKLTTNVPDTPPQRRIL
jgi:hypothetical protein